MSLLVEHASGLLTLTFSEPAKRNPLTPEIADALAKEIREAEASDLVRAVLILGSGGNFSSGGDLRAMPPADTIAAADRLRRYAALITTMAKSTLPMVCALEGTTAGIALGVATACDVIVADEQARLLFPFSRLGLFPDGGLIHGLASRVGPGRAKALLLVGDPVTAQRAYDMGLVDRLAPPGSAVALASDIARDLALRAPLSVGSIKSAFSDGVNALAPTLETERITQSRLYFSEDFTEGRAAFFDKRQAAFTGR
ncbi:enoyl-CoA hydratase/isomerase family protein [Microterricola pindariensis]|uniref:Enoyl-CoA hydratase n=1 Tax=Microterricola pindariensis TaxID=478010 RepID=A0ABX5AW90_9MICO|nr:enoyl-CoA hydratase-related protein [Microterricola pindariensis]PPL19198.1 hypothetical protein GY24_06970 [Microterricola pindariensis]